MVHYMMSATFVPRRYLYLLKMTYSIVQVSNLLKNGEVTLILLFLVEKKASNILLLIDAG